LHKYLALRTHFVIGFWNNIPEQTADVSSAPQTRYEIAYCVFMRQPNDTAWTLVHGVAAGVHHAWLENERANLVWEPQRNACARLDQWRSLAEAIYLGRWNQREAAHVIREQGWHYGPRVEYETTEVADTGTVVADD
jgi:hypothetical protein